VPALEPEGPLPPERLPDRPFSERYSWYVASFLMVVYIFNQMDRQILGILLEPIRVDLAMNDTQAGLLSGLAFAMFYVTLGIPLARWADRGNRVDIITIAVCLWSAMTAACGLASGFLQMLATRVGVGVGEAGCTPPAHSLLADYSTRANRSRMLAVYSLGIPLGGSFGMVLGGIVNQHFGWRAAFFAVGLPGLLLAVITKLTIVEPRRAVGVSMATPERVRVSAVLRAMVGSRTYLHLCIATSLFAFSAYGISLWCPAFLIRTHGVATGILGPALGAVGLLGGVFGILSGGWLGDALARRDPRWLVWVPAIALLIGVPFTLAGVFAPTWWLALLFFIIPLAAMSIYAGPVFGLIQTLMAPSMRAVAVAVFLFIVNLFGMGGGPLVVGVLSDAIGARVVGGGLRWSLAASTVFSVWGALHYHLAGRTLRQELEALPDPQ
jgi:MFS family permease